MCLLHSMKDMRLQLLLLLFAHFRLLPPQLIPGIIMLIPDLGFDSIILLICCFSSLRAMAIILADD